MGRTVEIALVGFNDRERLLMNSLFKVTGQYREWEEGRLPVPDCVLMDVDEETARACADMELEHPSGAPIVAIGNEVSGSSVAAFIPRPFRWADVVSALGAVTGRKQPAEEQRHGEIALKMVAPKAPAKDVTKPQDKARIDLAPQVGSSGDTQAVPAEPAAAGRPARAKAKPRVYKTVGAVLVVNPNPKGWRHISAEIADLGYRVDHVSTGEAAALLLQNFRYNCVIVESQLPDQEGFDLCRMLKRRGGRRRVATIVLSPSRSPLDQIRSRYVGCDAFLSKPLDKTELASTLKKFLPEYVLESAPEKPQKQQKQQVAA